MRHIKRHVFREYWKVYFMRHYRDSQNRLIIRSGNYIGYAKTEALRGVYEAI